MQLFIRLALIALLLAPALTPQAAHADNGSDTEVSDGGGSVDPDDNGRRKKPRFQTRFFD